MKIFKRLFVVYLNVSLMLFFAFFLLPRKSVASNWLTVPSAFQLPQVITLSKTANVTTARVGETITYTYYVTNSGQVTLTGVSILDDPLGVISLITSVLTPEVTTTGIATYTVQESDLPGPITSKATVAGTPPIGVNIFASVNHSVSIANSYALTIANIANLEAVEVGDTITYTYWITNIGDLPLKQISLSDNKLGMIPLEETKTITVGNSIITMATYTVGLADMPVITNTAIVSGIDPINRTAIATNTTTVKVTRGPAITITKKANVATAKKGDVITYTYWITNIGDITLTQLKLSDDKLGKISLNAVDLKAGASITPIATYTVKSTDKEAIVNVAMVEAMAVPPPGKPIGKLVVATSTVQVGLPVIYLPLIIKSLPPPPPPNPQIAILKQASSSEVLLGDVIRYDYLITNTGNVTLNQIELSDNPLGKIDLSVTELGAGKAIAATASYTVQRINLFNVKNIATVTAKFSNTTVSDVSAEIVVNVPTTQLSINNKNTGGIDPFELRTLDTDTVVVSCKIDSNNGIQPCGNFHPDTYKVIATTKKCGILQATMSYKAGSRTQEIYCN